MFSLQINLYTCIYIAVIFEITFWISLHLNYLYTVKFSLFFKCLVLSNFFIYFYYRTVYYLGDIKMGLFSLNQIHFYFKYLIPQFCHLASNFHNIKLWTPDFYIIFKSVRKIKMIEILKYGGVLFMILCRY